MSNEQYRDLTLHEIEGLKKCGTCIHANAELTHRTRIATDGIEWFGPNSLELFCENPALQNIHGYIAHKGQQEYEFGLAIPLVTISVDPDTLRCSLGSRLQDPTTPMTVVGCRNCAYYSQIDGVEDNHVFFEVNNLIVNGRFTLKAS